MLYKLIDGQNTFELNPELLAIPEFARLLTKTATVEDTDRDRRMKFCILVADRRSPLRTLPERERREKAARIVGCKMEGNRLDRNARDWVDGKNESIEAGISKYRELQYDENEDLLTTVKSQIDEIKEYLKSDKKNSKDYGKALEQAIKLGEKLPSLVESLQKLESLLNITSDYKPEIKTYSSLDLPQETEDGIESSESLSTIDKFHQMNQKRES